MASGRPRRPNDPSVMSSLESAVRQVRRPGPIEACWNWRWELGTVLTIVGLAGLIAASFGFAGLVAVSGAGLAVGAALLCWPPARSRVLARAWCVITPHQVRAGCVNAWVQTRSGRLPIIWSTTPTDYGERVLLWCPAGITADDLIGASGVLAAACWAAEVRVATDARHAHLVTLAVIRNIHPERTGPTPHGWPHPRRAAGDGAGEPEERDTHRWPRPAHRVGG
ncbi:MAG TPA: hypothetical protein VIL16_07115 [Trebonia sp.]